MLMLYIIFYCVNKLIQFQKTLRNEITKVCDQKIIIQRIYKKKFYNIFE